MTATTERWVLRITDKDRIMKGVALIALLMSTTGSGGLRRSDRQCHLRWQATASAGTVPPISRVIACQYSKRGSNTDRHRCH